MVMWHEFEGVVPAFAGEISNCLAQRRHCTLATLRSDGSPRLSGTELSLFDGNVYFAVQPGAQRLRDLDADTRIAVHIVAPDTDPENAGQWRGDVRIDGRAIRVDDQQRAAWCAAQMRPVPDVAFALYCIDIAAVVWVHISEDGAELFVDSWRAGRPTVVRSTR